jgi:hypothetical protein
MLLLPWKERGLEEREDWRGLGKDDGKRLGKEESGRRLGF